MQRQQPPAERRPASVRRTTCHCRRLSKRVLRRELDQPWRTRSACDPAEGRAALDVGERRDVEVRMVPDVEELRGELEILFLGQAEILPNGKIPVLQERPTEGVAAQIAVVGGAVGPDDSNSRRRARASRRENGGVEVSA